MKQLFEYQIRKSGSSEVGIIMPTLDSHRDKLKVGCNKLEGEIVYTYHENKVEFPKHLTLGVVEKK